jgi:apolipoprotein N-acyltransferase
MWAGILASALLLGLYVRGGAAWPLGFVALVPWLRTLDSNPRVAGTLLSAYVMSVACTAAMFPWFGAAIGRFTQIGEAAGLLLLLAVAPLFQPQFFAFALMRRFVGRHCGPVLCAIAGTAAWVATERLVPKLLGDTLGYGLHPSRLLRQAADLGGAAGLTALLLLANEAVSAALAHRREGIRAMFRPLAAAALPPLLLAGYGAATLAAAPGAAGEPLRIGMVQSNIVDYERLRREKGSGAVVREVLDTHFAMSYDAVARQRVHAVLWSETVYPTTFGQPKSEAGAELDREILGIVDAAGVPFVFGTYDRDAAGEYNAAAFVAPGAGLVGFYRKTRPFPLTEFVPAWLDGPTLRRWLPWAGTWQAGTGARVFPLRLADGREIPVLPLICLDAVDATLVIDGARLGARVILTLSNDSWFTDHPHGAELHQAVAAFRSIETRLPQFRVTSNGYSAVIDASGTVLAGSRMGERTLVVGDLPVREPPPTLMVEWGDWVGLASAALLVLLVAAIGWRRWAAAHVQLHASAAAAPPGLPAEVAVLPTAARLVAGVLRAVARGSLVWMAGAAWLGDTALQSNTLVQIRTFAVFFLAPEAAAALVLHAFAARASIEGGVLVLQRGARRIELALQDIAVVEAWRLPVPAWGASLRLTSGARWRYGIAKVEPAAFARALAAAGSGTTLVSPTSATAYARAALAIPRSRLDSPWAKFVVLPFLLAIPAFRLHQHIAYGSSLGEYYTFGLGAYLKGFALWWAAWAIGVVLCAAVLRTAIEASTLLVAQVQPARAVDVRRWLERLGTAVIYLGLPAWLLLRMLGT